MRALASRASHSDAISAINDSTIATTTSRTADAGRPARFQ